MNRTNSYNANTYAVTRFSAYDVPHGKNSFDYLKELCQSGLEKRYDSVTEKVQNRLNHELKIIKNMGFADCLLILWDIIRFAKSRGIAVELGRGRAAGSIAFYVLGITNVDPLRHALIFERFINPYSTDITRHYY